MSENQRIEFQSQQPVATRTRRFSNPTTNLNSLNDQQSIKSERLRNLTGNNVQSNQLSDTDITLDEIVIILKKDVATRGESDIKILDEYSFLIPEAEARIKMELAKSVLKQRAIEQEESLESIEQKAETLAQLIAESNYIVVYTGAGISTSASIPDYRGPNGLWTQIKKTGTFSITKIHDLTTAEPTLTHMAIRELCKRRVVNHVVSQNCDGLHLRSGIPQSHLSEIHGNMYIEVCPTCEKQYFRQADITERTSRFRHKTGRKCHTCAEPNNNLIDTIVLYGEKSRTQWPMNWERASKAAKRADLIICLGTSLKTLRRYNCLWPKSIHSSGRKEPETKLVIVNLQYTPKDKNAVLKINGKCDLVMQLVMQRLNIDVPSYDWSCDPLLKLSTPFTVEERADLKRNLIFETKSKCQPASPKSDSLKRQASSPSLFVSELTDDPEKKRLRMRIRAVNVGAISNQSEESSTSQDGIVIKKESDFVEEFVEEFQTEPGTPLKLESYALPGWLGKSLGSNKTSSYRRKRHGNKGRSHWSTLKRSNDESKSDTNNLTPDVITTETEDETPNTEQVTKKDKGSSETTMSDS